MNRHPELDQRPSAVIEGATEIFVRETGQFVGAIFARPYTNDFMLRLETDTAPVRSKSYDHLLAVASLAAD
jgi:hypothetical protein